MQGQILLDDRQFRPPKDSYVLDTAERSQRAGRRTRRSQDSWTQKAMSREPQGTETLQRPQIRRERVHGILNKMPPGCNAHSPARPERRARDIPIRGGHRVGRHDEERRLHGRRSHGGGTGRNPAGHDTRMGDRDQRSQRAGKEQIQRASPVQEYPAMIAGRIPKAGQPTHVSPRVRNHAETKSSPYRQRSRRRERGSQTLQRLRPQSDPSAHSRT